MTYLYGHRGAKGELPENSLSGFRFLRALGIHRVELDAHLSADGEIVIFHDSRLQRTTHQPGTVHSKTLHELQTLNVAAHWPQWSYVEPIPTLVELLEQWPELLSLQLDTKRIPKSRVSVFVEQLKTVLQNFKLRELIVTSEHHDILRQVALELPHISKGLITTPRTRKPLDQAQKLGCEFVIANHQQCNEKFLGAARKAQLKVSAWTVNDFNIYRQLAEANIHSIITDYPTLALAWQALKNDESTAS
jgi:glycerophosphoryl diester phosphodiesterase